MPQFNRLYNSQPDVPPPGKEKAGIHFVFKSTFKYFYNEEANNEFITS
jgi:hypothetical protein